MDSKTQVSQFIYGKYTGFNYGEDLVAWTDDLEKFKEQLKDLARNSYHFWGNHRLSEGDYKAIGICPINKLNDQFLLSDPDFSCKDFFLVQVSPAVNEQGEPQGSGGRSFEQYRFIFINRVLISNTKNFRGLLLANLLSEKIPCFEAPPSENKLWSRLGENIFQTENGFSYDEQESIFASEKLSVVQSLSALLDKRKPIITNDRQSTHPVAFLDHLLCWLPNSYRERLSLALGSLDENYCDWADLIVKTNGYPNEILPDTMIWIDRKNEKKSYDEANYFQHKYVRNFIIEPTIENHWIQPSKIFQHFDTFEYEGFDPARPSLDFILQYPVENQYFNQHKSLLLQEYFLEIKEQLQKFIDDEIDGLESSVSDKYLSLFWQALEKNVSCNALINILLKKIASLQPLRFLEISESDSFVEHVPGLLQESDFFNFFSSSKDSVEIIEALKQAFKKSIDRHSRGKIRRNVVLLCMQCKNILNDDERLELLTSEFLSKEIVFRDFKELFVNQIIDCLPGLSLSTFRKCMYSKLQTNSLNKVADDLYHLLNLKQEGTKHLPKIASSLELSNAETKTLYLKFIQRWALDYKQSMPLVVSSIERSMESMQFQLAPFLEIYEALKAKANLLPALSQIAHSSNDWLSWWNLGIVVNCEDIKEATVFLDRIVGHQFCTDMKGKWLNLLKNPQINSDVEREFLSGNTWKSLISDRYSYTKEIIENLKQSSSVDWVLEDCKKNGLKPLAILSFARSEVCTLETALKYIDDADESDGKYLSDCLKFLKKIPTKTEIESEKKGDSIRKYTRKIISMISQPDLREALTVCIDLP
jgi:hypothetical protein